MIFILFVSLILSQNGFAWGEQGHKLITRKAIELLPKEMNFFKKWTAELEDLSVEPDRRRNYDNTEHPKHFIDIDFYKEFNAGKMIFDKHELLKIYGDSIVTAMGILPWTIDDTYIALVKAMKDKNRDRILILSGDLAHYVGDASQPMHTILNYDGQLSGQKGIHARYESRMVDQYLDEIKNSMSSKPAFYIEDKMNFIFDFITESFSYHPVLFDADLKANSVSGSTNNDDYYRLLWFRTKYVTKRQFSSASGAIASLFYSAWVDAGKPDLKNVN